MTFVFGFVSFVFVTIIFWPGMYFHVGTSCVRLFLGSPDLCRHVFPSLCDLLLCSTKKVQSFCIFVFCFLLFVQQEERFNLCAIFVVLFDFVEAHVYFFCLIFGWMVAIIS